MLQSLAEADLDRLAELDIRCRDLFTGITSASLNDREADLAAEGIRSFLAFHVELQRACAEQRDQAAEELQRVRAARLGAKSYQDTEDRGT